MGTLKGILENFQLLWREGLRLRRTLLRVGLMFNFYSCCCLESWNYGEEGGKKEVRELKQSYTSRLVVS